MLKLMLLTSDVDFAKEAENAGIDRIFLDLEYINKNERQMGRNTFISSSTIDDVAKLRKVITKSEFLVRVNPIHPGSKEEIDRVIEDGADIVMLPMVMDADDVKQFVHFVNRRAKVCLLLETAQSLVRLDEILDVDGIDEIHIGLNDLHISMGLKFMFETLSGGIIEYMTQKIKSKGIPVGFGGIAKLGEGMIPTERVIGEHYRLGSSMVILSRTFRNEVDSENKKVDLRKEINRIREYEKIVSTWSMKQYIENQLAVKQGVNTIVNR